MEKRAILLGATGLTGGVLLKKLLQDDRFSKIRIFGRRSTGIAHHKIEEHLVDLLNYESFEDDFHADIVFCCVGTTKSKTPDKETYKKIDLGIPVTAAHLCSKHHINTFLVISALGADPDSRIFYNRMKGKMEQEVLAQGIPNTYIFQPALIGGEREEKRIGEQIAKFFFKYFSFLVPKKYKMIAPATIATAMLKTAIDGYQKHRIPSDEINKIVSK